MPDKELIYREDLIAEYDRVHIGAAGGARKLMVDAPAVDAVEVVRCKDCVNYEERFGGCGYCYHWDYEQGESPNRVDEDDFCSYGERKADD